MSSDRGILEQATIQVNLEQGTSQEVFRTCEFASYVGSTSRFTLDYVSFVRGSYEKIWTGVDSTTKSTLPMTCNEWTTANTTQSATIRVWSTSDLRTFSICMPLSRTEHFSSGPRLNNMQRLESERTAFLKIKNNLLHDPNYSGKYVAILGGVVVDSDEILLNLAKRVYAKHGYVPIYMPKVTTENRKFENTSRERASA